MAIMVAGMAISVEKIPVQLGSLQVDLKKVAIMWLGVSTETPLFTNFLAVKKLINTKQTV